MPATPGRHSPWRPIGHRPLVADIDTGGVFLDFLFGFVVAGIFEQAVKPGNPGPRTSQLALAGVLTVTSWIGYHQSKGRTPFELGYFNLPMFQFVVHLALVVVFFLLAARAEPVTIAHESQVSALPESVLTAIAFAGYLAWELTSEVVWTSDHFRDELQRLKDPVWNGLLAHPRVHPTATLGCVVIAAAAAFTVAIVDRHGRDFVMAVDLGLVLLIVGHRYLQGVVERLAAMRALV